MEKNGIQKTKDYGKFKDIVGNRMTYKRHVSEVAQEIEMNDLLEFCPIIVNEKLEIIDGQHRLAAAKRLQKDIYYLVVPGLDIRHVVRLNNSHKPWKMVDYVALHASLGNDQYIALQDFCSAHKVPLSVGIILCSRRAFLGGSGKAAFREGQFAMVDQDLGEELIAGIEALRSFVNAQILLRSNSFAAAVKKADHILRENGGSFQDVVDAYKKSGLIVQQSTLVQTYLREFENALRVGGKLKVRFD